MTHRRCGSLLISLAFIAALLPGCVPAAEPLSDPDKAEPDKRLLGKWVRSDEMDRCEIDSPTVKGNPKGLMRVLFDDKNDSKNAFWFFTTTIGKHTFATIYLEQDNKDFASFDKEGAFEKWNQGKDRCYYIFQLAVDGDKLAVDGGDKEAMTKLVQAVTIEGKTPPGWLATYLEKNGPRTLFNGTNVREWRRPKK